MDKDRKIAYLTSAVSLTNLVSIGLKLKGAVVSSQRISPAPPSWS